MPEEARKDALILYMHGGGLVCGNAGNSRGYASMLAGETKIPVWSISYRLAPEDPYPAAVNDAFSAYKDAVARYPGAAIFVIGESGGAYLSLTTALMAKDAGVQLPTGVILYSPVIDFSDTLDRSKCGWADNTVTQDGLHSLRSMYCPDPTVWRQPYCSPLFADYEGFPPALLAWDTGETLAADAEKMVELMQAAGVDLEYKAYEGCFHAFAPVGRYSPESYELLKDTVAFMYKHIS
jgi:epsilon-lactone hydrolase